MTDSLAFSLFQIIVLIYSVVLHELAHGLTARALGDPTAERMGRLTLNPIRHLDLFGSVLLPLFFALTHSPFMFGYAKPVPYDPDNLTDHRWGPSKVAIAGPLVNFTLAILAGAVLRMWGNVMPETMALMVGYMVWINIVLACFNLMPIPPLDGHWIFMALLPSRFYAFKVALYRYQWFLLAIALFFVFPQFAPVLGGLFSLLTGYRWF